MPRVGNLGPRFLFVFVLQKVEFGFMLIVDNRDQEDTNKITDFVKLYLQRERKMYLKIKFFLGISFFYITIYPLKFSRRRELNIKTYIKG